MLIVHNNNTVTKKMTTILVLFFVTIFVLFDITINSSTVERNVASFLSWKNITTLGRRELLQLGGRKPKKGLRRDPRTTIYKGSNTNGNERVSSINNNKLLNINGNVSRLHIRKQQQQNNNNNEKLSSSGGTNEPLVLYTIFAGRKATLELQSPYIQELLNKNIINEVHLWDFTCKQQQQQRKENSEYLRNTLLPLDERIYIIQVNEEECDWQEYYDFYTPLLVDDNDVLLKVDDDIIFIDTTRVQAFVDTIRGPYRDDVYLWSANIINNGISAALQNLDGKIPLTLGNMRSEVKCPRTGCLHMNSNVGLSLHNEFLSDPNKFFTTEKELRLIQSRISINFVGWSGKQYVPKTAMYVRNYIPNEDEMAVTQLAWEIYHEKLVVFMPLVVSHASFNMQHIQDDVIRLYKDRGPIRNTLPQSSHVKQQLQFPGFANE